MKYSIETLPDFDRQLKKLTKKYKSLKKDFEEFISELRQNPAAGADLGKGIRKVRMTVSDKGKGKSHGARVITHTAIISVEEGIITLLAIFHRYKNSKTSPGALFKWEAWEVILSVNIQLFFII